MPNSCNSITKNLCIILLFSSCASTQNYQTVTSFNGKFLANNGSDNIPFNVSLQSNSNIDIIQIKKPFYGNVLRAKVDKTSGEILSLKTINDLKQFELSNIKELSSQTIKMFYRCLNNSSQIQSLENEYLNANCSNSQDRILIKIDTGVWQISGFLNYE